MDDRNIEYGLKKLIGVFAITQDSCFRQWRMRTTDGNFLLGFSTGYIKNVETINFDTTITSVTTKLINLTGVSGVSTYNVGASKAIVKLSETKYRVLIGPFNDIKSLQNSFEKMGIFNFENLEVLDNV